MKPASPFLTQVGTSTGTLSPQPRKPPRNCICDVTSALQGASVFHSKRKNNTLNPLHMHKTTPRKASLKLTAHSVLDVGILLHNTLRTERFIR